jgi:hypothetical protein
MDCLLPPLLIGVVVGIELAYGDLWDEWIRRMQRRGIEIANPRDIVNVMGPEAQDEKEGTELVQSFIWLTRRVVESEKSNVRPCITGRTVKRDTFCYHPHKSLFQNFVDVLYIICWSLALSPSSSYYKVISNVM